MNSDIGYKLTLLLTRHPDLTPEAFADQWLEIDRRDPLVALGLVRYVFHRALPEAAPIQNVVDSPYDAVIETWWTRKNSAADWAVTREFEEVWLPPRLALLAERPAAVAGEPGVVWERELTDDMSPVSVIVLPTARRSLRFAEFAARWTGEHAELALGGPQTKDRLVRLENTPAPLAPPSRFSRTRFDGVGSITFASSDALVAEFGSSHYQETVAPDQPRFTNPEYSAAFVGTPVDLT